MEFLPIKERLVSKHVTVDHLCPLCNMEGESVMHALVTCPFTSSIWQAFWLNNPQDKTIGFAT